MKKWPQAERAQHRFLVCLALPLVAALLLQGCAGRRLRLAEDLRQEGRFEQALEQYLKELRAHPDRLFLKLEIDNLLREGAEYFSGLAAGETAKGNSGQAIAFLRKALEFDPGNSRVHQVLARLQQPADVPPVSSQGEPPPPALPAVFADSTPLDVEFRSGISLMELFRVIGRSAQLNVLFDPGFKDLRVVVSLKQMSSADALERLCQMYGCRYYVLNQNNLLIANDSPATRERYQEKVLKALPFSNIDAEEAKQIIDSTFKPERLITNKQGNSLIVIDAPENMAVVEKIAQFIDRRRGEVEIEADILEFDSKKLREFGSELSSWSLGASLADSDKGFSPDALKGMDFSADLRLSLPTVLWKFLSSVTDSRILARPRIRGLDKERIEIQLGEKRPILTTTFVPVSQGGVNQQAITSYTMTDVGILLNITPTVHHNDEITLELEFVLTYVIDIGDAYVPPTLGNRRVTTKLRLRNGETGVIAGLMRGSSTSSRSGIPILGQIPLLREIFSSNKRLNERTDILLSITPRILRMPDLAPGDIGSWQIGTGSKTEVQPLLPATGERAPKAQEKTKAAAQGKAKKSGKKAPRKDGEDALPEKKTDEQK
jgi:general secretion pathway protein D